MTPLPLAGIRVLDLSRVLAAPYACQMLFDLGAEVIKVERPGAGDDARLYGPPFVADAVDGAQTAAQFLSANRGKKSITVDIATAQGQDIIRKLARTCDVVAENFRAGALAKYGLDYAALSKENPGLIYCSVTGFGQDGPYAARPGYDGVFQAMSGMMSVSGDPDQPMKVGFSLSDILAGLHAAVAIVSALYGRTQGASGRHIDISLLDCSFSALTHVAQDYLLQRQVPKRGGRRGFGGAPSQSFECADGEIFVVGGGTPAQFSGLCDALGVPEVAQDARFNTSVGRKLNRDALLDILEARFRTGAVGHWMALLEPRGVPAGPVQTLEQAVDDPQLRHRVMVQETTSERLGVYPSISTPIRFAGEPLRPNAPAPALGEHSDEILREIGGYTPEAIKDLRTAKVV